MAIVWTAKPYLANGVVSLAAQIQADINAEILGDPMMMIPVTHDTREFDDEAIVIWRDMGAPE